MSDMSAKKKQRADDQDTLTFSLPKELKARLKQAAKEDFRTTSSYLVKLLTEEMARDKAAQKNLAK